MTKKALFVYLGLAACTNTPATMPTNNTTVSDTSAPSQNVRVLTFKERAADPGQPAPTYLMAAISGKLATRGDCLILEGPDRNFALVFREGSASYEPQTQTLMVDGKAYSIGADVQAGGSGGDAVVSTLSPDTASQCRVDGIWYVSPNSFSLRPNPGQ